jgi:hypothetical protein
MCLHSTISDIFGLGAQWAFDGFVPESTRGESSARQTWADEQLLLAAKASANRTEAHMTFSFREVRRSRSSEPQNAGVNNKGPLNAD